MNLAILMYSSKYQDDNDNFDYFKCVTWSPYERIDVKPVKSFKDLCKVGSVQNLNKEEQHMWTGVKQCLHLIGMNDDDKNFSLTDSNNGDYVFNTSDDQKNYDFYCVLSMRFAPVIHKMHKEGGNSEDEKLINRIKKNTVKIVKNHLPGDTVCTSFRSLGAEDMVIIFLSNSIKDIMNVVDTTRNIQFQYNTKTIDLFSTVYMFTGLNNPNCAKEIGVDLIVNLHLRKHNISDIENKLYEVGLSDVKNKVIFRGKGTMQLEIPSSVNTNILFDDNDGILNERSDFYKKNFYSSRVYFKEEADIHQNQESIDEKTGWITGDENKEQEHCDNAESYKKTAQMTDVAKFIFGEYERMMANNRFCQWRTILDEHYRVTLRFVSDYMHYDRLMECKLLDRMQSSLHLINQACSPASDIPYHNYYYSGSFSDLLKAYYGIINMLFNIIYRLPHSNETFQHKIVFAVRLEAIARIQSEMYTLRDSNDRLIVFSLPYDSFWDYAKNIQLLAHETFHYAAPYDRIQRNKDVLGIIFKTILTNYSQSISENYINNITKESSNKNFFDTVSQETREWNGYMLNAFKQDEEIRTKLCDNLYDKYLKFFTLPAPEWYVAFCKKKNLDRIVRMTADSVQEFITKNSVKAEEYVTNNLKAFKLKSYFDKLKIEEPDAAECSKITSTISTLNTSVKEAFCDIWAVKITGGNIAEYILGLFKVMIEINDLQRICNALAFEYPNLNISMFSMPVRLYLLLYYDFIEKQDRVFDPASALRSCSNSDTDENLKQCIEVFAEYLGKQASTFAMFRDELYDMAFRNLRDYFSGDEFAKSQEVITLREIYDYDLSSEVFETALDKCVYYDIPKCLPNKNYDIPDRDEIVNAFGNNYILVEHDYCSESNSPYIISSLSDYMACLNDIYRINKIGLEKHKLWYRGICNIKYSLLPSLFRKCDDSVSLYANQANIMKKAYFNSPASTELWNQSIQQKMASLQHYGVPTNLLDFSLDQFVALHFAVNPDSEKDRKEIDEKRFRPVVYVFNPIAYSKAIERLKSGNPNKAQVYNLSPVVFDFNQNSEEREKYFVGDMSYNHLVEHTKRYNTVDYMPNPCVDLYPVPMVIEHTNPRIKAQSGVFVAYPLDAQPQSKQIGERRYHYMDLMQIQTKYNQLMKNCQIDGPFLFTIEIQKDRVKSIRDELKQFNINSGKYYPELFRLFENIKD